ncbi:uncharacterized protein TNCV_4988041 [Trichonephila clavipes]|nr:uncharacterized protein TNCV_4988041 [Trichonephila clavipes]
MANRESIRNSTDITSSCKSRCVVQVYGIIYHWPYFFEKTSTFGPVTETTIGQRYEFLLCNHDILDLQQCGCVDGIIFMQDGAPPHIVNPVKQLLKGHFENAIFLQPGLPYQLILIHVTSD